MGVVWLAVVLSILSMAVGLIRDILIVQRLGFTLYADIIYIALLVPAILESTFGIVAKDWATAVFVKYSTLASGLRDRFAARAIIAIALLSATIAVAYLLVSKNLLLMLTPGWTWSGQMAAVDAFEMGAGLIFAQTLLYFFIGYQISNRRFLLSSIRPFFIGCAGVLVLYLWASTSLPQAFVASQAIAVAALAAFALREFIRDNALQVSSLRIDFTDFRSDVGEVKILLIVAVTALIQQMPTLIERVVATTIAAGVPTILSFVYRLVTIPLSLFTASVLAVLLPTLLHAKQSASDASLAELTSKGFFVSAALGIFSLGFLLLLKDDVAFLLQAWGIPTIDDGEQFAAIYRAYALGVPFFFVALYCLKIALVYDCSSAMILPGVFSAILQCFFALVLATKYGAGGIALASSLFFVSFAGLCFLRLRWRIRSRVEFAGLAKIAISTATSIILCGFLPMQNSFFELLLKVILFSTLIALLLYVLGERRILRYEYWKSLIGVQEK